MKIAHNPQTGEYLGLDGGEWKKLTIAANQSGDKLYLGPNGWTPLELNKAETPDKPGEKPLDNMGKLGLGTRNVLEGLGGLAGAVVNPFANTINAALGGDPNYFKNPGAALSDTLGLPRPQTAGERVAGAAIEGAAGALPTMGAGMAMQGAKVAPQIAGALADMPALQVASGLTGGAAMGAAQEGGAGVLGQAGAALAGGLLPAGAGIAGNVGMRTLRGTAGALDRLTTGGQERLAGTALERLSADPRRVRELLAQGGGELVEGSLPTTAQLSEDRGLALLEKALASGTKGGDITARYTAQKEAQGEALNRLLNPVQSRIEEEAAGIPRRLQGFAPNQAMSEERALGETIRNAFEGQYGAMKKRVGEAYEAIDPEGTARFDVRPLLGKFEESIGGGRYSVVPGEIKDILTTMQDDIANGATLSYRDLQDVRTRINDILQSAGEKGDAPTKRIAGLMKQNLDDYLEKSGSIEYEPLLASPGSRTYKEASRIGAEVVEQDPYFSSLDYLHEQGLNRRIFEESFGPDTVKEINSMYPNLIRKGGRLGYDDVATEIGYESGDDLVYGLMERLGGQYGRKRAAQGNVRDEMLSSQAEAAMGTGFTPEQAAQFERAKRLRRQQGESFEQGANIPLTRYGKALEGGAVDSSQIPGAYFRPGGRGSESMEALAKRALGADDLAEDFSLAVRPFGAAPEAGQAMREYAIQKALEKATDKNGRIDPAKLGGFLKEYGPALGQMNDEGLTGVFRDVLKAAATNKAAAKQLQGLAKTDRAGNWELLKGKNRQFPEVRGAGLKASERERLQAIQQDIKRVLDTDSRAAVKGSPTAQLQNALKEIGLHKAGTQGGGGLLRNIVNKTLSHVTGFADENIDRLLVNAALDPQEALRLLSNTNTQQGQGLAESFRRWASSGRGAEGLGEDLGRYLRQVPLGLARNLPGAESKNPGQRALLEQLLAR